jgi:hypothetical protein
MSRINLRIEKIIVQGFHPAERTSLLDGLQTELRRTLAKTQNRVRRTGSDNVRALNLGRMPFAGGSSGARKFGEGIAGAIGRELER